MYYGKKSHLNYFIRIGETDPKLYTKNHLKLTLSNCGLWVLNEILEETYPENLKKNVGDVWELPTK